MFDFLRGRMRGMGGGQQQGGGFMGRLRQNFQRPQLQQAAGAIGAQMLGFDPALGMAAAQGMQNHRLQQGFDRAIKPIERMRMDPQHFLGGPGRDPRAPIAPGVPAAPRGPGIPGLGQPDYLSNALGGNGGWQDPRLRALSLGRTSGPLY